MKEGIVGVYFEVHPFRCVESDAPPPLLLSPWRVMMRANRPGKESTLEMRQPETTFINLDKALDGMNRSNGGLLHQNTRFCPSKRKGSFRTLACQITSTRQSAGVAVLEVKGGEAKQNSLHRTDGPRRHGGCLPY